MLIFYLTILHLIHDTYGTYNCKVPTGSGAYAEDGYIKAKMSVVFQVCRVLTDLQHVLHEDAGLDLNASAQNILPPQGYLSAGCV